MIERETRKRNCKDLNTKKEGKLFSSFEPQINAYPLLYNGGSYHEFN